MAEIQLIERLPASVTRLESRNMPPSCDKSHAEHSRNDGKRPRALTSCDYSQAKKRKASSQLAVTSFPALTEAQSVADARQATQFDAPMKMKMKM